MNEDTGCGLLIIIVILIWVASMIVDGCNSLVKKFTPKTADELFYDAEDKFYNQEYEDALQLVKKAIDKDSVNGEYFILEGKIENLINPSSGKESFAFGISHLSAEKQKKEVVEVALWMAKEGMDKDLELFLKNHWSTSQIHDKEKFSTLKKVTDYFLRYNEYERAVNFVKEISDKWIKSEDIKCDYYDYNAKLHLVGKDTLQAIEIYKNYLEETTCNEQMLLSLGYTLAEINERNEAIKVFKKYLKIQNSGEIQNQIGYLYYLNKNNRKAKYHFKLSKNLGYEQGCINYRELTSKVKYYYTGRTICCDGWISYSSGRGTCSHHGGICQFETTPETVYTVDCN